MSLLSEAKKGRDIHDLLRGYSPPTLEELRKSARTSTPIIEQNLKVFEPCLEADLGLGDVRAIAEKGARTLTPHEINLFLQSSIKYDDNRWYAGAMGVFISVLMKKSYEAGYTKFALNVDNFTSRLDNLWSERDYPGIHLMVKGNLGDYFGSFARKSYLYIKGDVDDYPSGNAENCTFVFDGNVREFYVHTHPNQYIFHGEVGKMGSVNEKWSTFKTSNNRTLQQLMSLVGQKNEIYFIHKDGTEKLVRT